MLKLGVLALEDGEQVGNRSVDTLGGILKRHENNNTKFSLLYKFFRLRLGIGSVLTGTM